jgi:hypothetical protein
MISSYLIVLFSLGVLLTLTASFTLISHPEVSFLTAMFAILLFVASAYGANMIEVYTSVVANSTTSGTVTISRDPAIQWLSVAGMLLDAVLLVSILLESYCNLQLVNVNPHSPQLFQFS